MPTLAIRKTTLDGLSTSRKRLFELVSRSLEFGQPALYEAAGNQWYVYDDSRISLVDIAVLGCFAANVADVPTGYDLTDKSRAQIETALRAFFGAKLKMPSTLDYTGQANPWQFTLTANGAPITIRAAGSIPVGLTPVVVVNP